MKNEQPSPNSEWVRSLVESHAADLTRYAASILGDPDAAKDVVQDSFIRLWREPREKVEDHVRPWLFRVCRSRALDHRRKGGRMKPLSEYDVATRPAEGQGPEEAVEQRDSHAQVLGLMQQLPENQREVVRLKFQNDLSYKEIANITELSVSNVGFLLHTALQTLRAQVAATGE
jgi:RNA polymerase sigma-70 factor (ECF subfamily)